MVRRHKHIRKPGKKCKRNTPEEIRIANGAAPAEAAQPRRTPKKPKSMRRFKKDQNVEWWDPLTKQHRIGLVLDAELVNNHRLMKVLDLSGAENGPIIVVSPGAVRKIGGRKRWPEIKKAWRQLKIARIRGTPYSRTAGGKPAWNEETARSYKQGFADEARSLRKTNLTDR